MDLAILTAIDAYQREQCAAERALREHPEMALQIQRALDAARRDLCSEICAALLARRRPN